MDAVGLHLNIDYLGSSGLILSPEQKAALQTSLVILQNENKFNRVYFWGKIFGVKDDYYIAEGVNRDEFAGRKTFYSKDCVNWALLPPATEAMRTQSKLAKGRFTGDPSYEYEHVTTKKVGEGEEATEEEETITIKEEDRLTSVISEIDRGCLDRAQGFFHQDTHRRGLSVSESAKLCNYVHFREPAVLNQKSLLQRANLDKAIDCMDNLEEDIPRGSWSLQFERGSGLVVLRSLLWEGYVLYHVPGTRSFGSAYFGIGEKNLDLPFML